MSKIDVLIARAREAQPTVGGEDLDARVARAAASASALDARADQIVEAAVDEIGTTEAFARRELRSAMGFIGAVPHLAQALRPVPVPAVTGTTQLRWEPYGTVFGWHAANSPIWVPTLVAISGLVAGNAVIGRPSRRARETTGLVLDAIAQAWPEGALGIAQLDPEPAQELMVHPGIHAIVAHASTATCARHIHHLAEAYSRGVPMRPYIPEASGNDAAVVLAGADMEHAAEAIALGAFANNGQLCMAAKRILVQRSVWPRFRRELVHAVAKIDESDTHRTHVQNGTPAYQEARECIDEARRTGGEVICGGYNDDEVHATLVSVPAHALCQLRLWQHEVFAPVRCVVQVDDATEAVTRANDSRYGLGAALFGGDAPERELFTRGVRASRVLVDEGPLYQDPHLVVGGVGDSGLAGAQPKMHQLVWAKRVHWAK